MASVYIYDLKTEKLACLNRLCKFAQNKQNTIAIKEVAYLIYINVKDWNQGGYVLILKAAVPGVKYSRFRWARAST